MQNVTAQYLRALLLRRTVLLVGSLICVLLAVSAVAQNQTFATEQENKTIKLHPLPLDHVRLTGGPLKAAQDADAKYLLELQPDRMLALLRQRAGLKPKAEAYGGWEAPGRNLTGHIAGHYLSGVCLMWAATGPEPIGKAKKIRLVDGLQDIHNRLLDDLVLQTQNIQGPL